MMIDTTPFSERPRERCLERGAESLSLRECLALVIGSGPKGSGCMGLAQNILAKPGAGLSALDEERAFFTCLEISANTIVREVAGLGEAGQARLLAVFEIARRYSNFREQSKRPRAKLHLAGDLSKVALEKVTSSLRNEAREWLGFIPFYRSGEMGEVCVVEKGVRTHVNIDPAELFARLLALRPQAFFLVHNHPSGNLMPSAPDHDLTRRVQNLSRQLGIRLLGHWIVAPAGEFSIPLE